LNLIGPCFCEKRETNCSEEDEPPRSIKDDRAGESFSCPIPSEFILSIERALTGQPCVQLSCNEASKRTVQLDAQLLAWHKKKYTDPFRHDIMPDLWTTLQPAHLYKSWSSKQLMSARVRSSIPILRSNTEYTDLVDDLPACLLERVSSMCIFYSELVQPETQRVRTENLGMRTI